MLPWAVAHVPAAEVLRHHAKRRIGLHDHVLDAAAIDEVVDVAAAPGDRQRVVDVGHRQPERGGLLRIDVEAELRRILLRRWAARWPAACPCDAMPRNWLRAAISAACPWPLSSFR